MLEGSVCSDLRWNGNHGIGRYAQQVSRLCGFDSIDISGNPLSAMDPIRLKLALSKIKPAHFYSPGMNAPLGRPCSFSISLYDLIPVDIIEEQTFLKTIYYERYLKPALSRADIIFTSSQNSKSAIVNWAGIDENKIVCIYGGVDSAFTQAGNQWINARPYILYVGNQRAHKNVEGLIKAFAASGLGTKFDLLLTGNMTRSVSAEVQASKMVGIVRSVGFVEEKRLPSLYRGAQATLIPSRSEGFCLPVIESMAVGTPVFCSNKTALPEIGGEAAIYFDPDNFDFFVSVLSQLQDESLLRKHSLLGLNRSKLFTWEDVAKRVKKSIAQLV